MKAKAAHFMRAWLDSLGFVLLIILVPCMIGLLFAAIIIMAGYG